MLVEGLIYTVEATVGIDNSARTMGSGDLDVLATPAMVALMEKAAMIAVAERLPEGSTTVGSLLNVTHSRPTALGGEVSATAELTMVEDRKLVFRVTATDRNGIIGEGEHVRFIVDRERFMAKLAE